MSTLTTPVTVTLFTEARAELLEKLAAAETNLKIAYFEEDQMWKSYNFVVDEHLEGRTEKDIIDEYGKRALRYTQNRREKWQTVDALKTQLLALPDVDEAAALDDAKHSLNAARLDGIEKADGMRKNAEHIGQGLWYDGFDEEPYIVVAAAARLAAIALSKQVVAHLPR